MSKIADFFEKIIDNPDNMEYNILYVKIFIVIFER